MLAIALKTAISHVAKLDLVADVLASEAQYGLVCTCEILNFNDKVVNSPDSLELVNVFFSFFFSFFHCYYPNGEGHGGADIFRAY